MVCNINLIDFDIVFFDNLACNLIPAHELGWKVVYITPFHSQIQSDNEHIYSNINTAIGKFIKN